MLTGTRTWPTKCANSSGAFQTGSFQRFSYTKRNQIEKNKTESQGIGKLRCACGQHFLSIPPKKKKKKPKQHTAGKNYSSWNCITVKAILHVLRLTWRLQKSPCQGIFFAGAEGNKWKHITGSFSGRTCKGSSLGCDSVKLNIYGYRKKYNKNCLTQTSPNVVRRQGKSWQTAITKHDAAKKMDGKGIQRSWTASCAKGAAVRKAPITNNEQKRNISNTCMRTAHISPSTASTYVHLVYFAESQVKAFALRGRKPTAVIRQILAKRRWWSRRVILGITVFSAL